MFNKRLPLVDDLRMFKLCSLAQYDRITNIQKNPQKLIHSLQTQSKTVYNNLEPRTFYVMNISKN